MLYLALLVLTTHGAHAIRHVFTSESTMRLERAAWAVTFMIYVISIVGVIRAL